MGAKFSFWAYGILAIAAFALFLYVGSCLAGRPDIGNPLLTLASFIVIAFIVYMFVKLALTRGGF
mgnify:CR=1 FL=1